MAMFGLTAKDWREANPNLKGNIRDYATINELICLSNMENLNSVFIEQGLPQSERLMKLNQIAIQQMSVLENEKKLIKSIVNFKSNVKKAQEGLKEKFGYDSTFDEDSNVLNVTTLNETNEGLKMVAAKQYVHSIISENEIHVQF